jgi:hypothetical protein
MRCALARLDQNIALLSARRYGPHVNPQTDRLSKASQQLLSDVSAPRAAAPHLRILRRYRYHVPIGLYDAPRRLLVRIRRDERSASYKIDAKIVRDGNKAMSAATPLLLVPGLVFLKDRVARFDDCGAFEWVNVLRQYGTLRVPFTSRTGLLSEMAALPALPPLAAPEEPDEQRNSTVRPS